jgi:pimeloyl-ACP methyl ester carboxylesterase
MADERILTANGVDLCVQTLGEAALPATLLIHRASASMYAWEDEFCRRLAEGGRLVIRYDHRDTGRSVSYPPGRPPYGMRDLMEDAIGILDALGIDRVHLVGRSIGGGLAALAALHHPDRVETLTLMASTPGKAGLSPPSESFLAHLSSGPPDWTVNGASSQTNHFRIALGEPFRHRLDEIRVPTLIVHGESDPIFPIDHAEALAREIPGARLLVLPDCRHLILPASWDWLIPALLEHTSGLRVHQDGSRLRR